MVRKSAPQQVTPHGRAERRWCCYINMVLELVLETCKGDEMGGIYGA